MNNETPPVVGDIFISPRGGRRYRILSVSGLKTALWNEAFKREDEAFWPLMTPENGWKKEERGWKRSR